MGVGLTLAEGVRVFVGVLVTVVVRVEVGVKVGVAVPTTTVMVAPFTGAPVTFSLLVEVSPWPVRLLELANPTL